MLSGTGHAPGAAHPSPALGPETITWRRAGDVRVLLAAGYALVLQVAHPTVGAGVSEHSSFQRDPWGRLLRTLDYACTMVYGGEAAARETGARIRATHRQIKGVRPDGQRYSALEPEAYAWVHATLAQGIVIAHERFGRRLGEKQREELWAQWLALGPLLGIRAGDLPADWPGFCRYFDEMTMHRLKRTQAVDEVLAALARPAPPAPELYRPFWPILRMPLAHGVLLSTVGLLSPALRSQLGIRWTRREETELRALAVALRAATPVMPSWLRNTGPGYLRWRSLDRQNNAQRAREESDLMTSQSGGEIDGKRQGAARTSP
jgi:uncharacterized protein (DUF2236 family)